MSVIMTPFTIYGAVYHSLLQAIGWTAHIYNRFAHTLLQTQESGRSTSRRNSDGLVFFMYALCIQVLLSCLFNWFIRAAALLKVSHCCLWTFVDVTEIQVAAPSVHDNEELSMAPLGLLGPATWNSDLWCQIALHLVQRHVWSVPVG